MKWRKALTVSLVLGGLLLNARAGALSKNHGAHRRGEPAAKHPGANSNARWSADPSRGWVRAAERGDSKKPDSASKRGADKRKQKATIIDY